VPQLLRAFMTFDTFTANRILDEALRVRQVETVCVGLLQPALTRASELGTRHELNIPEERYAINYVRAQLFAIFANTPERYDGPTAIVACGPREMYDVGALMLATFWRRAGLQVVFLGADIDGPALVQAIQKRRPRVACVSVMTTQRLRALARVAKEVTQMDPPAPLFTYSGTVFARHPELKRKVTGVYLGDDPATATWQVMRLLGMDPAMPPPANLPHGHMGQVS
jgi:methanogenic corrinoid protein MtbC1